MLVIIKPTHQCNLRCSYCYVDNNLKDKKEMFSLDFARHMIDEIYSYAIEKSITNITLLWHGGEPLLWTNKNYENIFQYCEKVFNDSFKIRHSIQTNLTLINNEYIDIFKKFDVSVGFSLDGFGEINDKTRYFQNKKGSFAKIFEKIELCKSLNFKICAVVVASSKNINYINEIYSFMNEHNISFKINPIFKSGEAEDSFNEYGITTYQYQTCMIELFDLWTNEKKTNVDISLFSEIASNLATNNPALCNFKEDCQQNVFSIFANGDIYPCGRFGNDNNFNFGNLRKDSLSNIMKKKNNFFGNKRVQNLTNNDCNNCKYLSICHGGCMHDAYISSNDIFTQSNFCQAYKHIFQHIEKYLIKNNIKLAIN